ncbi:MAG TPA: methylenetetrahydrofolate reductase [Trebonia sp.]|nr:methylenetetrahydrofolate reductase [Trebonia sp.]
MSTLRDRLAAGEFTITAELSPPRGASAAAMLTRAELLRGWVDAVNITDNQGSHVRLSSWAGAVAVKQSGTIEPIMQMTCRDRNRIALQSDLLGAGAHGIENVLFMSGDHPKFGDHPGAKPVFDMDSTQLIWTARTMRDEAKLISGKELNPAPRFFIGAVENPFAPPLEYRAQRAAKKIAAGAQFIQTQYVFDIDVFRRWVTGLGELGVLDRCFILAGVGVIRSVRMLDFLSSGKVPGVQIPEPVVRRLRGVAPDDVGAEGALLAAEVIAAVRDLPGVSGVHLLTAGYEKQTPELLRMAGIDRSALVGRALAGKSSDAH